MVTSPIWILITIVVGIGFIIAFVFCAYLVGIVLCFVWKIFQFIFFIALATLGLAIVFGSAWYLAKYFKLI